MADTAYEKREAKGIRELVTADDLIKKVELLQRGRQVKEREWKLNLAFYRGKQYSWFNPYAGRIESLATDEGMLPRQRVRLVSNQIVVGTHSLLSKLLKTKPRFSATPGSGEERDVKAAQMAEVLMEFWWQEFDLDSKLEEALLWAIIGGQGFWKITWDEHAGKSMRFLLDPYGQPIMDEAEKEAFRAQLEQFGIQPEEQVVYLGDIRVDVLSPHQVLLDPAAKVAEDAKYAFCIHYLDPDEVESRWGVKVRPDSVPASPEETIPMDNAEDRAEKSLKKVIIGYFKPSAIMPNGRYVVFCDGPEKGILQDEPWPYPSPELPLVKFPGVRVPGSVYDDAITTHARPLQKELNKTLSQIVEYKNLMTRPRVWAPVGSLRTKLTTEAGAAYEYIPVNGLKPEPEQLPTLPAYVFEHLKDINGRLREIYSLTEVTEGTVPPNVEAGVAIDLLQEMATDRLAPTIKLIEQALARAGQQMLILAQQYYQEPRLLKIKGEGGSTQVRKFSQADIAGGIDIQVETGSGLPRTRAGRQAHIMKLVEMGVLPIEKAWKHLDLADLKSVQAQFQADEDLAYREHEKLLMGAPVNPDAIQGAMLALNQGINPETNERFIGDEFEAQMILERAAFSPGLADNHAVHADIHGLHMKSVEFEGWPEDARRRFIMHYQMTVEQLSKVPQPEPEAPRVSLNLRAATGPTAATRVLEKAGVEVAPAEMAEPPLETWVTDSVDKPDADADGPGQSGAEIREQELRKKKAEADFAEKKAKQGPPPHSKGK